MVPLEKTIGEKEMSTVTNVLLCMSHDDAETKIPEINSFFKNPAQAFRQEPIREDCGGTKCMEANVFPAAFNGLDLMAFCTHLMMMGWSNRDEVQLFYCRQDEDIFSEWRPTRGWNVE